MTWTSWSWGQVLRSSLESWGWRWLTEDEDAGARLWERNWMHKKVFSHVSEISKSVNQAHFVPGRPARVLTYLCFFVSSFFLWSPPSSRFKTWPQDSTSRSTHSGSLLFYSSDFCWSPFTFNMRESSYLKNLVHPGTVYSISSVNSNPSLKSFHWSSPLFWYTLHCLWGQFATTLPPSNLLYQSLLLSFVHYTLHHLILFPVNPLRHL